MQDVGAEMLAKAIAKNTNLTQLQLSNNKIGDRGAQALAAVSGAGRRRGWGQPVGQQTKVHRRRSGLQYDMGATSDMYTYFHNRASRTVCFHSSSPHTGSHEVQSELQQHDRCSSACLPQLA
jgi:hypothetical protein